MRIQFDVSSCIYALTPEMSIYRTIHPARLDVDTVANLNEADTKTPRAPADPSPVAAPWSGRRRAEPSDRLLPMTIRWAMALPEGQRPVALLDNYPRIANRVAASWAIAAEFTACVDELLEDRRGDRQGFPPEVQNELLELRKHYGLWVIDYTRPDVDLNR